MRRCFNRAFLPDLPPLNLAMCRIILGTWVAYYFTSHGPRFVTACTQSPADLFHPVGVVSLLSAPLPPQVFHGLYATLLVTSVFFLIGFAHRALAPIFALLLLFLWTYRNSWGFIYHTENTLVLSALILALAPSADTFSVDAWIVANSPKLRKTLGSHAHEAPVRSPLLHAIRRGTADYRYGWPVQLIILVVTISYSVAGWAKLGAQGLAWADGSTLEGQILRNAYWYEMIAGAAPQNTVAVLRWPSWMFTGLATMTLVLEVFGPLVLLSRRVTLLYALVMFSFHWGVKLTMGIPFIYHLYGFAFAAFIPWEWVKERAKNWKENETALGLHWPSPSDPGNTSTL
jgi:hypothetical protein